MLHLNKEKRLCWWGPKEFSLLFAPYGAELSLLQLCYGARPRMPSRAQHERLDSQFLLTIN